MNEQPPITHALGDKYLSLIEQEKGIPVSDYTPSTGEVRASYLGVPENWLDEQIAAEFDRWLNEERAKAYDEGFDQGHYINPEESRDCGCRENPYRKADS